MYNIVLFFSVCATSLKYSLSAVDLSGSGDGETTLESKCIPVLSASSTFNDSVYRTTKNPELLARCASACIDYHVVSAVTRYCMLEVSACLLFFSAMMLFASRILHQLHMPMNLIVVQE